MKNIVKIIALAALVPAFANTMESTSAVAQNATFNTNQRVFNGSLQPYVDGGSKPYHYIRSEEAPINGTVIINDDGTFAFTVHPLRNQGSFRYYVNDSHNRVSNEATVTINVNFPSKIRQITPQIKRTAGWAARQGYFIPEETEEEEVQPKG